MRWRPRLSVTAWISEEARVEQLVADLWRSVEAQTWYAALALALVIPDIAGNVERPNEKSYETRYAKWWETYVGDYWRGTSECSPGHLPVLTGRDAYALRSSFLHEGQASIRMRDNVRHFVLLTPEEAGEAFHRDTMRGVMFLSIEHYCGEIILAATRWIEHRREAKLPIEPMRMVRWREGVIVPASE